LLLAATLGTVACASPSEPTSAATVEVTQSQIPATLVVDGVYKFIRFTLPLAIHNISARNFTYGSCYVRVEARVEGRWRSAWVPVCGFSSREVVQPGETRVLNFALFGFREGTGDPEWSAPLDAPLRVVVCEIPADERQNPSACASSNTFRLLPTP
jgi:hypothetical protein